MKRVARIGGSGGARGRRCSSPAASACSVRRGDARTQQTASIRAPRTPCSRPRSAGSLEQIIENLQSRLRVLPHGLAGVRIARPRLRAAGARHGRPQLLPEGAGRAATLARAGAARQLRGHGGHGRARRRPARLRRRAAVGRAGQGDQPVQRQRLRRDRRRAGRARPVSATRSPRSRRWWTRGRASRRTPASRTRASCMGDVPGAIQAMEAARDIAGTPADSAWASYQLGELYFNQGRPRRRASAPTRRGVATRCGLRPAVRGARQGGVGARDISSEAIAGYTDVVSRYPSPEYVIALGDLYAAAGQTRAGRAAVRARPRRGAALPGERRERRPGAGAVRRGPRRSGGRARRPLATSGPSGTACTWPTRYAWALLRRRARTREAAVYAREGHGARLPQRPVRVPRRDDPARSSGTGRGARRLLAEALDINPHFSIQYAPVARATLATLGGAA